MSIVIEALISASVGLLLEKLGPLIFEVFQPRRNLGVNFRKLEITLKNLQAMVDDAERKQSDSTQVKAWLEEIKHLIYDAEDVLDEYATEVGRSKLESDIKAEKDEVRTSFLCCSPINKAKDRISVKKKMNKFDYPGMASRIEEITLKLEELTNERDRLHLIQVTGGMGVPISQRRQTSSLVDESGIYGRENDKNNIVELLLSNGERGGGGLEVIPIVGMGGLGKTILAQLVYNDKRLEGHFDIKAWFYVSTEADVSIITKGIIESVTGEGCDLLQLQPLQVKLQKTLIGKRFLLVLDDVWNENCDDWETLQAPLTFGKQGSKVLVTTRSTVVSSVMGTTVAYSLKGLSNDDCWLLFKQRAFAVNNEQPNLIEIGKGIVKKCKGLPIAVKTLGSLLRSKVDEKDWQYILDSNEWNVPEEKGNVLLALRLSYQYLPSNLKQCFTYCSIFPKGYVFEKEELVLLWMAEGFLSSTRQKQMEDIGEEYFDDLLSRSFFQYSSDDKTKFVMHDLIHDLAQSVSNDTCFRSEGNKCKIPPRARHASFCPIQGQQIKINAFCEAKSLRTYFQPRYYEILYDDKHIDDLFLSLRCLRVLCLHGSLNELPDSIGNLRLLRYLDVRNLDITWLPESICSLYNLQSIILPSCLSRLPNGLHNLVNLRHVLAPNGWKVEAMPPGMGSLTSLRTLAEFAVGNKRGCCRIGELRNLKHLRERLLIAGVENALTVHDVKEANLNNKEHVQALDLRWSDDSQGGRIQLAEEIVEFLQPHSNLKGLYIRNYYGLRFPTWIGVLSKLEVVELIDCKEIEVLPLLGELPMLRHLTIEGMDKLRYIGQEFYGKGFQSLETLAFRRNHKWVEWYFGGEDQEKEDSKCEILFPCLELLTIEDCPKLGRFPSYCFPALVVLKLQNCQDLTAPSRRMIVSHESSSSSSSSLPMKDNGEFPKLLGLEMRNCPKLKELPERLPSLEILVIDKCVELVALPWIPSPRRLVLMNVYMEILLTRVPKLPSLSSLYIGNTERPVYLPEQLLQSLTALKQLVIQNCSNLEKEITGLEYLVSLQSLKVIECPELETLPHLHKLTKLEGLHIENTPSLTSMTLPPKLETLFISSCKRLEFFNMGLHNFTHLEFLLISNCPGFTLSSTTVEGEGQLLPTSLKTLSILECSNFEFPTMSGWLDKLTSLQTLWIHQCPLLVHFPGGRWPALKEISLTICINLESLPMELNNLTTLEELRILVCRHLVTFPESGLPTKLRRLVIGGFGENRDTLPKHLELNKLASLEQLTISNCPGLVSFFSEKGEEGEGFLPSSLRELQLLDLENLESLRELHLHQLTSLEYLAIRNARMVKSLPREGLPPNLQTLDLFKCPHLEKLYKKDTGKQWPKIFHICAQGFGHFSLSDRGWKFDMDPSIKFPKQIPTEGRDFVTRIQYGSRRLYPSNMNKQVPLHMASTT
ncbi:PREDICTED: putative disease resistance RPP13-like protein 1 [Nelumbo nucifera]|uniref:Disease resistance RPP13-like protein 1 n=2 Tax=Nelumbo nucifera TaxID=4432 RepID=A0A1U8BGV3_NELNU|nr:PREDICTED: putative disease resistance RPP13-like protein 1 [Nelumbo nucifera]DAD45256.1 TPA_asm: hypothetical protein HUJ06_003486 [Nelumbo nucifera]